MEEGNRLCYQKLENGTMQLQVPVIRSLYYISEKFLVRNNKAFGKTPDLFVEREISVEPKSSIMKSRAMAAFFPIREAVRK